MNSGSLPHSLDEELGPKFPRRFGNYIFLTRLARGGMGEVFLAKHGGIAGIEKYCVVKTLRPHYTDDREYTTRFIDEARVVVQLSHRNVAQVFDVGRVGGQYYLAMEFIQGLDLRTLQNMLLTNNQNFSEGLGLHILCEVLEALDYAHRHEDPATGIPLFLVHRDVSPQNVMINLEGEVKLIDFGLAASELKLENTQPNVVMGKLAYMAPEHARGDPVNGQADLFSAAVMGYELVSGERFYSGMTQHEMWSVSGRGGHRPPHFLSLPKALRLIFDKALAPERDDRFHSCAEFREALEAYRFANKHRERASSLRELLASVSPEEAEKNRRLLKGFANVTLASNENAEPSESLVHATDENVRVLSNESSVPADEGLHEDTVVDMVPSVPHPIAPVSASIPTVTVPDSSRMVTPVVDDKPSYLKVALLASLILLGGALALGFVPGVDFFGSTDDAAPMPVTARAHAQTPPKVSQKEKDKAKPLVTSATKASVPKALKKKHRIERKRTKPKVTAKEPSLKEKLAKIKRTRACKRFAQMARNTKPVKSSRKVIDRMYNTCVKKP